MPKLPLAYQAFVCGIRNGPTTSPTMSTKPPVASVKYSRTLPVGIVPVEKNRSRNESAVRTIGLSEKSTSTTMILTAPRNGARSAPAARSTVSEVPNGKLSGGRIMPSLKPSALGSRAIASESASTLLLRPRSFSSSAPSRSLSSGLGATKHGSIA
jgi:hypothetical protein